MSDDVAFYMAFCDECEVYAKVECVVDHDGEQTTVELSCGHEMPLFEDDDDDDGDEQDSDSAVCEGCQEPEWLCECERESDETFRYEAMKEEGVSFLSEWHEAALNDEPVPGDPEYEHE